MKLLPMLIAFTLACSRVCAQADDDTVRYEQGLPVTGEDTIAYRDSVDRPPRDVMIRIPNSRVPEALKNNLDEGDLFQGWRKAGIMIERNTGLFVLRLTRDSTTRIYHFNKNGKAVAYSEVTDN